MDRFACALELRNSIRGPHVDELIYVENRHVNVGLHYADMHVLAELISARGHSYVSLLMMYELAKDSELSTRAVIGLYRAQ